MSFFVICTCHPRSYYSTNHLTPSICAFIFQLCHRYFCMFHHMKRVNLSGKLIIVEFIWCSSLHNWFFLRFFLCLNTSSFGIMYKKITWGYILDSIFSFIWEFSKHYKNWPVWKGASVLWLWHINQGLNYTIHYKKRFFSL